MNLSIIAFAAMAALTIVFFAAMMFLEFKSRPAKSPKNDSEKAQDPDHPAAFFERSIMQPDPSPAPFAESLPSNASNEKRVLRGE